MSIEKSSTICLVLPTQQEIEAFTIALAECGFRKILSFKSCTEAYEICTRQQVHSFITRMEMPDWTGITFIQKLRQTGNYGMETHLFVTSKLDSGLINTLAEVDIPYVLKAPFNRQAIKDKFQHLIQTENSLTPLIMKYREAKSAFYTNMLDMSEELVTQVIKECPTMEQALILKGDILLARKSLVEAEKCFTSAIVANPKSAAAMHKLAQVKMAGNDYAGASVILNKLATVNPYNINLLQNAGLSCFNSDQLDLAKQHMGKVIALDSTNKQAASVVAEVQVKQQDFDGIIDTLRKSHTDKDVISFLNNAGIKLSKGDDVPGAIKMYSAALNYLTESQYLYAIHYNLGVAYKKTNNREEAIKHLKIALKKKPDFDKAAASLRELEQIAA